MILLVFSVPAALASFVAFVALVLAMGASPAIAATTLEAGADSARLDAESNASNDAETEDADLADAEAPVPLAPASTHPAHELVPPEAPSAPDAEAVVRLHDRAVFALRAPQGALSAPTRARSAAQALERLVDEREAPEIHFEEQGDVAIVLAGKTPIVQLRAEDARAAGDATLALHAASVTAKIREAVHGERQRKAIAETVFSLSLLVFSGLIAVLLLGKVRELAAKGREWIDSNPDKLPALHIQSIELVRPAAVRGSLSVSLGIARILSQLGIAYGWLLFASSLFEATRTYTERLTGFVLVPLSALVGRVGSALPLVVVALSATAATVLLVRFVGLFFGSVGRGETALGWLPTDLAVPTGALVRIGIVIVALLVAAPLITGNDDGALARAGMAALVALGFASSPVLASVAAGVPAVYGRKVRLGEYAEVGGRTGRVVALSLLEVRLEDDMGCQVRIPHLMSLFHPTRSLGPFPVIELDVVVDALAPQAQVRRVVVATLRRFGATSRVDLLRLDADGAHYRVVARSSPTFADEDLSTAIADALARENIALGHGGGRRP